MLKICILVSNYSTVSMSTNLITWRWIIKLESSLVLLIYVGSLNLKA